MWLRWPRVRIPSITPRERAEVGESGPAVTRLLALRGFESLRSHVNVNNVDVRQQIIARYGAPAAGGGVQFCGGQDGKVVFATVRHALDAGKELHAAGSDRMKPYPCPNGTHFHLRSVKGG